MQRGSFGWDNFLFRSLLPVHAVGTCRAAVGRRDRWLDRLQSIDAIRNSALNALTESFNVALKREILKNSKWLAVGVMRSGDVCGSTLPVGILGASISAPRLLNSEF